MGIIQENRLNAPQPEVKDTDYGARYVKAATETPVSEIPPAKKEEVKVEPVPAAKEGDVTTVVLDKSSASVGKSEITTVITQKEEKPKKKAGRPKKNKR